MACFAQKRQTRVPKLTMTWFVYILRCADGTYYTGSTTDPARRLGEHNRGKGCRYTAVRRPVEMIYLEEWETRSLAQQRENALKRLSRREKEALLLEKGFELKKNVENGRKLHVSAEFVLNQHCEVMEMAVETIISHLAAYEGQDVIIKGWLYNKRSSGKISFLQIRDGYGFIQGVVVKGEVPDEVFSLCDKLTQESSIIVTGTVRADKRAPSGFELSVKNVEVVQIAEQPYPVPLKEHGIDFLLDHRHLWMRAPRPHAILRIRAEVMRSAMEWLDSHDFIRMDAPIFTPTACEGTTTLFETDYFDRKAYLSQSGQLYNEVHAMAFGKVYCFGPTFRAEKSKTRRHLQEFWQLEPEMAFVDQEGNMKVQEELISHIVNSVLKKFRQELMMLGRDVSKLENIVPPFPRMSYDEAIEYLQSQGHEIKWGDDFGAPDETVLANRFDKPVFITGFPTAIKAFYMKPDPNRPEVVLAADLLAPEGYGEIIGGSQRIDDPELLAERYAEHGLSMEHYGWYMDLRKYGSVPHSGFGLGIERLVTWICGIEHLREAIPFPRMLYRLNP